MESIEPTGIPHNEEHLEALEKTIQELKDILRQKSNTLSRHENILKELEILGIIIKGLYQKAEFLREEDKKLNERQPQSEEEWNNWIFRTEKITDLYSKISDLEKEFEDLLKEAETIQKYFGVL